jgi:hypothetical protein
MCAEINRECGGARSDCETLMSAGSTDHDDVPLMQQLYNRIWLLALAAILFFAVVYVGWGLLDILSVPAR